MTTAWHLTADHALLDIDGDGLFSETGRIAGYVDPTLKFIERRSGEVVYYEPRILGGAISAVYWARKARRSELRTYVSAAACALMGTGGRVAFLHDDMSHSSPHAPPDPMEIRDLDAVLESVRRDEFGWWELDLGPVSFLFESVEARLFRPISINGGASATGFFADYAVTARGVRRAVELLREGLAEEGAWTSSVPAPVVLGWSTSAVDELERVSGRTLFA